MTDSFEPQHCFVNAEGYMICNWKYINGEPRRTKSGKCWKWFVGYRPGKQKETTDES